MYVVRHQTISMYITRILFGGLSHIVEITKIVAGIEKTGGTVMAALDDVLGYPWKGKTAGQDHYKLN